MLLAKPLCRSLFINKTNGFIAESWLRWALFTAFNIAGGCADIQPLAAPEQRVTGLRGNPVYAAAWSSTRKNGAGAGIVIRKSSAPLLVLVILCELIFWTQRTPWLGMRCIIHYQWAKFPRYGRSDFPGHPGKRSLWSGAAAGFRKAGTVGCSPCRTFLAGETATEISGRRYVPSLVRAFIPVKTSGYNSDAAVGKCSGNRL